MKMIMKKKIFIKELYSQLLIIFLARKGFFSKSNKNKLEGLFGISFQYLFFSLLVFLIFLLLQSNPIILYEKIPSIKDSYFIYMFIVVLSIMVLGIFYEDFYFFKTKTDKTLKIFFGFSSIKIIIVVILKNLIITLPLFISLFYLNKLYLNKKIFSITIIFFIIALISYGINYFFYNIRNKILILSKSKRSLYIKRINVYVKYYFSIIPLKFLFVNIGVSLISILILFIAKNFSGDFDLFTFNENHKYFFTTLFISNMIFTGKNVSLGIIGLNKDIDYIKTLPTNLLCYFWSMFIVGYILVLIPALSLYIYYLIYINSTIYNIVYSLLAIILGYTVITLIQFYQGFKLKDIKFKDFYNFLNYKLPISVRAYGYAFSLFNLFQYIIFNKFTNTKIFVFCLLSLILVSLLIIRKINILIKED